MMSTSSPARSMGGNTPTTPMASSSNYEEDLRNKTFEGQLFKFTNLVKGWQYRWFILRPQTGHLEYYMMEESSHGQPPVIGKHRASQQLVGTVVLPSDEDSQAFNVVFASGEMYKLRASNTRERQAWVDRIRHVGQLYDNALAQNHHNPTTFVKPGTPPPGAKSHLSSNGHPSDALQTLSLSVLDAFGSVHDILQQTDVKHQSLARSIETLPLRSNIENYPACLDEDLLLIKATSQAALQSLESALAVLQELQEVGKPAVSLSAPSKSKFPLSAPIPLSPRRSLTNRPEVHVSGLASTRFGGSSQSMNAASDGFSSHRLAPDNISVKSVQVSSVHSSGLLSASLQPSSNLSTSTPSVNLASGGATGGCSSGDEGRKHKKDKKLTIPSSEKEKGGQGS